MTSGEPAVAGDLEQQGINCYALYSNQSICTLDMEHFSLEKTTRCPVLAELLTPGGYFGAVEANLRDLDEPFERALKP